MSTVSSSKLLAALTLESNQAAFLCRVAQIDNPQISTEVSDKAAICVLLGDLLIKHGLKIETVCTIIIESKTAICEYIETMAGRSNDRLFSLQIVDGNYVVWPGLKRPLSLNSLAFRDPPTSLPIQSLALSVTGIFKQILPSLITA